MVSKRRPTARRRAIAAMPRRAGPSGAAAWLAPAGRVCTPPQESSGRTIPCARSRDVTGTVFRVVTRTVLATSPPASPGPRAGEGECASVFVRVKKNGLEPGRPAGRPGSEEGDDGGDVVHLPLRPGPALPQHPARLPRAHTHTRTRTHTHTHTHTRAVSGSSAPQLPLTPAPARGCLHPAVGTVRF